MTRALPVAAVVAALGIATAARVDVTLTAPTLPQAPGAPAPAATLPASPVITEGARLFIWYNCGDCHGAGGSGAMAAALADNRWRYGGSAGEVFRSIAEGRPAGMPAWGAIIPGPQMIALTAYVRSLGDGKDLSTENFTGATVERSGH